MASIVSKRTMACRRGYQPFRFSSLCRFTKYALSSHGNSMTTFAVLNHVPMQFPFTENRILLRASSYCYVDNECNVGCLWQLLECRMCFSEPNKKPFSLVCQPSTWRLQLGDSTSVCLCLYAIRVRRCVLMVIFFGRKYTSYPYKKIKFCQVRLCKRQCSYISENKLSPSV